jgi:tetratricopeptide (TPR) repeat protein
MTKQRPRLALLGLLAASLAPACRPDDQTTRSIDPDAAERTRAELPAELVEHLDSGNAAYRARDFEEARDQYRAAVALDSTSTAAWFGLSMAERALGNADAAAEALKRAQDLAPGASLIHGSEDEG